MKRYTKYLIIFTIIIGLFAMVYFRYTKQMGFIDPDAIITEKVITINNHDYTLYKLDLYKYTTLLNGVLNIPFNVAWQDPPDFMTMLNIYIDEIKSISVSDIGNILVTFIKYMGNVNIFMFNIIVFLINDFIVLPLKLMIQPIIVMYTVLGFGWAEDTNGIYSGLMQIWNIHIPQMAYIQY